MCVGGGFLAENVTRISFAKRDEYLYVDQGLFFFKKKKGNKTRW